MYSKIPQFMDVAARLLFGEIPAPPGNLPVSVPGVDYDLISATAPDPDQTIPLSLDIPQPSIPLPEPTDVPQFVIGDLIPVKTGVILDHNGHPVPDGTPVQFVMSIGAVEVTTQSEVTKGGVARTTFLIEQSGTLSIHARSDPALNSTVLQFDVAPAILLPTQSPSPQPATPTPTLEIIPTSTPAATVTPTVDKTDSTNFTNWLVATLTTIGLVIGIYRLTTAFSAMRWGVRAALLSLIGGALAYTSLLFRFPGSSRLISTTGELGVIAVTMIGVGIGWGASLSWQRIQAAARKRGSSD
jgi:beta-N-acetylhexosaminidase